MDMTNAPPGRVVKSFHSKITRDSLSRSGRKECGLPWRFYSDLDFDFAVIEERLRVSWYFNLEGKIGQAEPRWPRRLSEAVFGKNDPMQYTIRVKGIQLEHTVREVFNPDHTLVVATRREVREVPIILSEREFPAWILARGTYPDSYPVQLDGSTSHYLDKVRIELMGRKAGVLEPVPPTAPYFIGWDLSDFNDKSGVVRH